MAEVSVVNDSHTESTIALQVLINFLVKTLFLDRGGVFSPFPHILHLCDVSNWPGVACYCQGYILINFKVTVGSSTLTN